MNKPLSVLLLSAVILSGCSSKSNSSWNPNNWFRNSESQPVDAQGDYNPLIPSRRAVSFFGENEDNTYRGWEVGEVTELLVERRPGGALIRATGVTDRQNAFAVKLVPVEAETDADTLTFAFSALQARGPVGSENSRTITAVTWLTDNQLDGIREIRVKAARNVRSSRR